MLTPSFGLTATERVLPKLALDFTTASLDNRIAFARALNTATRVNASGLIEMVNANLPRFDYSPITLACKGLLIEEARTNYLLHSNDFSNAAYTAQNITISASSEISPEGATNAQTITNDTSNAEHRFYQLIGSIGTRSSSIFAKAGTAAFISISLQGTASNYAEFNLLNGTVVSSANGSARIENYGNGWYRCFYENPTGNDQFFVINMGESAGQAIPGTSYVGTGKTVHLYGGQTELGAFSTSYIPTTTTALTRNADVATMTGTNFSSWFNASEGTFELDFIQPFAYSGNTYIFACNAATNGERLSFLTESTPRAFWYCAAGGADVAAITAGNITLNQVTKQVAAYKLDNYGMAVNGGNAGTDTSGAVPSGLSTLYFGTNVGGGNRWGGWVQKVKFWPQRLLNSELSAFSK